MKAETNGVRADGLIFDGPHDRSLSQAQWLKQSAAVDVGHGLGFAGLRISREHSSFDRWQVG
jgi:hypothetical protein